MNNEIILSEVRALGVSDPLKATSETIKVVLNAYLTRRALSEDSLRGYLLLLNPSLEILVDGLKSFSLDQAGLSHKTQETIRLAIQVLSARLADPAIGEREAQEIRTAVLDLVREARLESAEHRIFSLGFAALAASAFIAAVGGVLAMTENRRRLNAGAGLALLLKPKE